MNFYEFLMALNDERSLAIFNELNTESHIPTIVHDHLWQQLKIYFITGGLPEVVATYVKTQDNLLQALQEVREQQKTLITAYYADFAKHSGKINSMHITRVWRSIPEQLAKAQDGSASRYKFKGVIPGVSRYANLVGPIDWLEAAGLIIKVPVCHSGELPLSAYTKENIFKLYCFDVGILGALSNLPPTAIMNYDYGTYKGYYAENYVAQEFQGHDVELFSWNEGTAEVEFLRVLDTKVIPIEVKSGWVTHAKSIRVFQEKYKSLYRVIMSAKNLKIDTVHKVHHYPLYLCSQFPF
jgi:predicted AAA+ superfamily ATPase